MINMHSLSQDKLDLAVIGLEYANDKKEDFIQLIVEVSYDVFKKIEEEALFNFYPLVRKNEVFNFDFYKNIILRVQLRDSFAKKLREANLSEAKIIQLLEEESSDFTFLNQTESWLLLNATQVQELPPELADSGTLKIGVSTIYDDSIVADSKTTDPLDIANNYFKSNEFIVEKINKNTLKTIVKGQEYKWDALIYNNDKQGSLMVYSMFPELIPENDRTEIARMLVKINYQLGVGAFEMDTDDGELRFRTAILYKNDLINTTLFENLFLINIRTVEKFINDIFMKISSK